MINRTAIRELAHAITGMNLYLGPQINTCILNNQIIIRINRNVNDNITHTYRRQMPAFSLAVKRPQAAIIAGMYDRI
jgi:hypothetical protein